MRTWRILFILHVRIPFRQQFQDTSNHLEHKPGDILLDKVHFHQQEHTYQALDIHSHLILRDISNLLLDNKLDSLPQSHNLGPFVSMYLACCILWNQRLQGTFLPKGHMLLGNGLGSLGLSGYMCQASDIPWYPCHLDNASHLHHSGLDSLLGSPSPWGHKYLPSGIFLTDPILQSIAFHSLHNGLDNLLGKKNL